MGFLEMMQAEDDFLDHVISGLVTGREAIEELAERAERGEIVSTGNLSGRVIA